MDTPALLGSLTVLGYAAYYALVCAALPFGPCRRCNGHATLSSALSRTSFRSCPRCGGTGRRVRVGRRVYERLLSEYQHGRD